MIPGAAHREWLAASVARSALDATGGPGEPATAVEYRVHAERTVGLLAETLARLHRTDVGDPAPAEPATAPAIAAEVAGRLRGRARDATVPSAAYAHMDVERLVSILVDGADAVQGRATAPVLCHGWPDLHHLWCDHGRAVGFVDWRRARMGDRYLDLAIAARSVATDLSPMLLALLFERYGVRDPDPVRLDWYSLAAELTTIGAGAERS